MDEDVSAATLALFAGTNPPTEVTTTTTPPPAPGDVRVSIFNAGGVTGEARRVSYVYSEGGFEIGTVDTAAKEQARTTVTHAPGAESMGELVAAWLGPDPIVEEGASLEGGEVVVTLGGDFETVAEPSEDSGGGGSDAASEDLPGSSGEGVPPPARTPPRDLRRPLPRPPHQGGLRGSPPAGLECD
ncbi:MAG: LytR C-terminal domain-containing protein [Microthrixaceae bacterium]|nr:LytR C-terminal domain-containing protein [Microthrixaceae bacterium]